MAECPHCQLDFARWKALKDRPKAPAAAPAAPAAGARFLGLPLEFAVPAAVATLAALAMSLRFRYWMPLPDWWETLSGWLFLVSGANLAFHEAGHPIFGMLSGGNEFITAAGGSLMQMLVPTACLAAFLRQKSLAGAGVCLWWVGLNLFELSWYAADAQQQVIILITGMSGAEGGMHDYGTMFDALGVRKFCVGIARTFFFVPGVWLMTFAPLWGAMAALRRFHEPPKAD